MVAAQQYFTPGQVVDNIQVCGGVLHAHPPGKVARQENSILCRNDIFPVLNDFFGMVNPVFAKPVHRFVNRSPEMQVRNGKQTHFPHLFLFCKTIGPASCRTVVFFAFMYGILYTVHFRKNIQLFIECL